MQAATKILVYQGIPVEIRVKKIRRISLNVLAPNGQVRISVPLRTTKAEIENILGKNWDWVLKKINLVRSYDYPPDREMISGESFSIWGEKYCLQWEPVSEKTLEKPLRVDPNTQTITLYAPTESSPADRFHLLQQWHKQELLEKLSDYFQYWEQRLGVQAKQVRIRRMKTKWGSCNTKTGSITINSELVRFPPTCTSYTVLHELVHLLERGHNQRFYRLLTEQMPDWKQHRQILNAKPLILEKAADRG